MLPFKKLEYFFEFGFIIILFTENKYSQFVVNTCYNLFGDINGII